MFCSRNTTRKATIKNVRAMSSFLGKLFGKSSPKIPMDTVYPAVSLPTHTTSPAVNTNVSTLSNGLKVVTESARTPVTTIGLVADVGSRYEDQSVAGITNFMERMILKSTTNRPAFRLVRDMSKLGADLSAISTRESLTITAQTASDVNPVLGAIADLATNPAFTFDEIQSEIQSYKDEAKNRKEAKDAIINDVIHTAAFGNQGLGASMFATEHTLENFDTVTLKAWHSAFFTPKRMTLVATGVEHESFVALAEEMFAQLPKDNDQIPRETTDYVGNDIRMYDPEYNGLTHVALGFNAPSWNSKNVYAAAVLQMILGGGSSFSSGGPGKGLYSRIYQNVLKHSWVESAVSFNSIYSDAGLFGVYGTAPAEAAGALTEVLAAELKNLSTVNEEEVARAKNLLKSSVLSYLVNDISRVEEIGRFFNMTGKYDSKAILQAIDAVTVNDVVAEAKTICSSPISVATYGDASAVPQKITL